ncbi:MAG: hypothetical protein K5871_02020 [Lachnospiraceae bacterium]|nr:hypothetical protein [Lachnospiraceae bacterium]
MKNFKIDDKSKFLSAVLMCVLLVGLAYFFGYKKLEDKATRLNNENRNLETRISSLETYYLTEEQNKKDTETMTAAIAQVFSAYPGDARFEDGLFEAYNLHSGSYSTLVLESIGFAKPTAVRTIAAETVTAAGIEAYTDAIIFNRFDVDYKGDLTYEGLKGMVREIANGNYNLAIGKMTFSITESGLIHGDALISFYSVRNAGCSYSEPPVIAYDTGIENLFGVNGTVITETVEGN